MLCSVRLSPLTMFSSTRPRENWSSVTAIFAASIGDSSGGWTASRKRIRSVWATIAAASTWTSWGPVASSAPLKPSPSIAPASCFR